MNNMAHVTSAPHPAELRLVAVREAIDHLIAHVEDHGEDAASDSVYEDLLRIRNMMMPDTTRETA